MMNASNLYAALISKDFVNVGPATAARLLSAFTPEELLEHLDGRDSEVFRKIKGISELTILGLYRGYMVLRQKIELAGFLDKIGLAEANVNKLYDVWGAQALEKIRKNPYQLLFVLPWEVIEPIGLSLGIEHHPCRLVGAVENCMYQYYEQDKNTCIPPSLLLEKVASLLGCDNVVAEQAILYALKVGAILEHAKMLQLPAAYSFERQIEYLLSGNQEYDISEDAVRKYLRNGKYHTLTKEQENVVINALQNRFSVCYGRGGRGKTFTLSAICDAAADLLEWKGRPVLPVLCAVTAKACQRMRKETGRDTRTVASIIYKTKRRDLENKIVICDEASMLSLSDAYHLIKKIPNTSRFVTLGDNGQLLSVDAGRFLYDVINSKAIPCLELTINQRQDEKTDKQLEIILSGKFPELEDYRPGVQTGLFQAIVKDVFAAEEEARKLYTEFEGKAQIISPLKKYTGGSDSINDLIHKKHHGRSGYCKGTPVIFTKNMDLTNKAGRLSIPMANGSRGVITAVLKQNPTSGDPYLMVNFEFEGEVALTWSEASEFLEMAYCLTCHKAQGSDWDTVIIVLPRSDRLVDRNMIYTCLSRCKVRAILIYYDHNYVANQVQSPPAHERRRSALFGGSNV
jgi:exodeoxyribonuclease V alpha subunit